MDVDMDNVDLFDPVDSLNDLESTYYEKGYQEGFDHGKLHGLFEGRELGQEKCFDWWEELGFIEGQAMFWKRLSDAQGDGRIDSKKITSTTDIPPTPITPPTEMDESADTAVGEGDLAGLMTRIRAKYRLVCSLVGVKPRLAVKNTVEGDVMADNNAAVDSSSGIEGVSMLPSSNADRNQDAGPQIDSRLLQF
ncbi:hypothetical protein QFC19_002487 [Naganishia cerealis]|uniref:Uncharacterized protein n=1 Tax=Naganishia cerealis TaxID=610337 RepID=A0ACC2WAN7_9TREE|nr:hypothetical protein QFC19_002487 [Naganishia cerealis]